MAGKKRARNVVLDFFVPTRGNGKHPHALRRAVILPVFALVIVSEVSLLVLTSAGVAIPGMFAAVVPAVVTDLTNKERSRTSLTPLTSNATLAAAAQKKANDMAAKGYFAHKSPDGKLPWFWFDQTGYDYKYAGENLAVDFNDSADLVKAWMNSPAHRENILKSNYTQIGIGMATGTYQGRKTIFVVQFFGTPRASKATTAPKNSLNFVRETTAASGTRVLGAEDERVSWWENAAASPRAFVSYGLIALALLFSALLIIGFLPMPRGSPHPNAVVYGAGLLAVLLGLLIVNYALIAPPIVAVNDAQHASVVSALE